MVREFGNTPMSTCVGNFLPPTIPQGLQFSLMDPMGTRRVQASGTGQVEQNGKSLPFGDSDSCFGLGALISPTEHLFTGKERDAESGLDYFPARYYGSSMGRFMSPDPSGLYMADPGNPQQLNLYAYVGNNPLRFTDLLGLSGDCGRNLHPGVVCAVTTAWDWLKGHFGGGGDSGSQNKPSAPGGGGGGPEPDLNLSPGVSPLRFKNRDAAGIAASRQALIPTSIYDLSNQACKNVGCQYEYGGLVLKDKGGQYTFTNPVTFKDSGSFWTSHVMVPFGYRKVGSYHTHSGIGAPGMSGNPGDAGSADSQHLPEYMGEEMSEKCMEIRGR